MLTKKDQESIESFPEINCPMIFDSPGQSEPEGICPMIFDLPEQSEQELIEPMDFFPPPESKGECASIVDSPDDVKPNDSCQSAKEYIDPMKFNHEQQEFSKEKSVTIEAKNNFSEILPTANNSIHTLQGVNITTNNVNDIQKDQTKASRSPYSTMCKLKSKIGIIITGDSQIFAFNGKHYTNITLSDLNRLIVATFRESVYEKGVPKYVDDIADFALKEPSLYMRELPVDTNLVAFNNGVLNLTTRKLSSFSKDYYIFCGINANYVSPSYICCPNFDAFLERITNGDVNLIERIWQFIGYTLTPDTSAKVFFLLQGVPNSGKSALVTVLSKLFDGDCVTTLDVHSYGEKFSVSELYGKFLAISPDLPAESLDSKAVGKIKQLTGNDVISASVKYKNNLQFRNYAKIILVTNHPILLKMKDSAFYDRIVTIPFKYSIPKSEQRYNLIDDLLRERDGIVSKAILAYYKLVSTNYNFAGHYLPNQVVMGGQIYDEDTSVSIFKFLQANFERDESGMVFTSEAHRKYVETHRDIALNEFSRYFFEYAETLFSAQKKRKHKFSKDNATSCIIGIRWKYSASNNGIAD